MKKVVSFLDQKFYPNFQKNWDDYLFRDEILRSTNKEYKLLDLGAGAGIIPAMNFRGTVSKIFGIDPDPRVLSNPYLDEAKISMGENIPYPDDFFDIVIADNVMEHLPNPQAVLTEVNRVLKLNGVFYFKTPNKWHYMPTIARLTPHQFHQYLNKLRGRATIDTFPTTYQINSPRKINYYAQSTGFSVKFVKLIEGRPEYLRFSPLTYLAGFLYERLVNSTQFFSRFRILTIACLEKKSIRDQTHCNS